MRDAVVFDQNLNGHLRGVNSIVGVDRRSVLFRETVGFRPREPGCLVSLHARGRKEST